MSTCDICGKHGNLFKIIVEGMNLNACADCSGYEIKRGTEAVKPKPIKLQAIDAIICDYASRIRKKRESMDITQKELAVKINEKLSIIQSIEAGRIQPELALARKLEMFLRIVLIEREKEDFGGKIDFKDRSLTIGDVINLNDK